MFLCGNGGSAALASHLAVDLGKGCSRNRPKRFRVLSLNDNMPWLTALANDVSYEDVFVEQLRNFAQPGDVLLAISSSGNSKNILKAVEYANQTGCVDSRPFRFRRRQAEGPVQASRPRAGGTHGPDRGRPDGRGTHPGLRLHGRGRRGVGNRCDLEIANRLSLLIAVDNMRFTRALDLTLRHTFATARRRRTWPTMCWCGSAGRA